MKLLRLQKVKEGKYLKNYELTYLNKKGKEKVYEIVSRNDIPDASALGNRVSGVSIVAYCGERMLLLREFRMGVNHDVYNLCAGMVEEGESIEECIRRELYEETGLQVKKILQILKPSYAAVAFSDVKTQIAFVEAEGVFEDHTSDNEMIEAEFYTKEEVRELLETEEFSSRAQLAAYFFARE
ncbi:MAG: NUDIX hydrolase [Blautia sp.]|nr:NUDIX hydrolase [Blautia sp.]MCM1200534.1 NUDIX hydrolase [Bacteroides fragilis]